MAGMIAYLVKVALALLFAYLALHDGFGDGNAVYAALFVLLSLEYLVDLIEEHGRS